MIHDEDFSCTMYRASKSVIYFRLQSAIADTRNIERKGSRLNRLSKNGIVPTDVYNMLSIEK
ncbi:MAG: hypothetical protein AABY38_01850 [Planctomycetota bacterium]